MRLKCLNLECHVFEMSDDVQGKRCQGRKPMATFIDGLQLARKANLNEMGQTAAKQDPLRGR